MHFIDTIAGDPSLSWSADAVDPGPAPAQTGTYSDARGEIRRIALGAAKHNALLTLAGHMRSGDFHPNTQFDVILSGRAELLTIEQGREKWRLLLPNTMIAIRPYVPHLFRFPEDAVMLEWWDGPFKCWYWKPLRDIIDGNGSQFTAGDSANNS